MNTVTRPLNKVTNPAEIQQKVFAPKAQVVRTSESGYVLSPLGALNTAVKVGKGASVMVFNSANQTKYVKFGDSAVTAPSDASDGVPILAGEKFMLNSGDNDFIISDDNTCYGFLGE
jgi:hypothetical protein